MLITESVDLKEFVKMNEEDRMRFLYKKRTVALKTYDPIFE